MKLTMKPPAARDFPQTRSFRLTQTTHVRQLLSTILACPETEDTGHNRHLPLVRKLRLLSRTKLRPGSCFHVAQRRRHPGVFRVSFEKRMRQEVITARVTAAGDKAHDGCHTTVRRLALHGAAGKIGRPIPYRHAARR